MGKAITRSIIAFTLIASMLLFDIGSIPNYKIAKAAENLAYKKTVTVSSVDSPSRAGAYAVDGDGTTRWSSDYSDYQYIIVDLGSNYSISQVKLAWEVAYATQFQIQTSLDNSSWTTVYSNYNATGGTQTITFEATTARYVKVYCIKRATNYGFSLYEFEVYGSASSSSKNLALQKAVTVSSVETSSFPGSYAVDGNNSTRWSSSYADNQYIIVDLGSNYSISEVKLAWESAYASQFQIQTSLDNSSWTTVYSNYSATGGTQTISFASTTARYVKVYCIKRATSYGFSLYEFEVYDSGGSGQSGKNKVLDYFYSISGSKTVLGIHNREPNSEPSKQTDRIYSITGQYPALWSGDFLFASDDVANRWTMIRECKKQWDNGSIVQLLMHVVPPTQSEPGIWDGGVVSKLSDSQWNSLITNGGSLNVAWKQRLDEYAVYLQYLKDNGVVVLFRPFHEMNQGVFWWAGRSGSNGTAALFRLTRDYLENTKGLNNLIWVWDMQDLDYNWSGYNPGDAYWDIFALDVYNGDGFTTTKYNTALQVAGNKPIAIGECAKLPTASQLQAQPRWVFCMSWAELTFENNTNSAIQNLYKADNVIVRSKLPNLK